MYVCVVAHMIVVLVGSPIPVCEGDHCAVPMHKGDVAPFAGQLLSTPLAIDLSIKADSCDDRIKLELTFQKKTLDLNLDLEKRLRQIDFEAAQIKEALLLERLEEAQGIAWHDHPVFVASVSVVATVLLIWGARETLKTW